MGRAQWVAERTGGEASSSGREAQSHTLVHVGVEGSGLVGHIALQDALREDACQVVSGLKDLGITVMLLSGDRATAALEMAQQVRSTRLLKCGEGRIKG